MTKFYKRIVVSGTANKEILSDLLTSTVEELKKVVALWFTENTTQHNAVLRAYVEREKILDMSMTHFTLDYGQDDKLIPCRIEIDMDLPIGQTLSVGAVSGGTASDFEVVVEYEKSA